MGGRSLRASQKGIQLAKQAQLRMGLRQQDLMRRAYVSRQPISKFFAGKPVDRHIFERICEILGLNWREVADLPKDTELAEQNQNTNLDIDAFVQEARKKIKPRILQHCGSMQVLGRSKPIGLNDIYTKVNILEEIPGLRRKDLAKFRQEDKSEDSERFELGRTREGVPGLEAVERYPKLVILGKPGAGKTTFLKYLAIQCIEGQFKADCVPIFVSLRDFAEASEASDKLGLIDYITQQYLGSSYKENPKNFLHQVIESGRALFLLDGLDEVEKEENKHVLRQIRNIINIKLYYYHKNNFFITCRVAALDYIHDSFQKVEIADFDRDQIFTFVTKWFQGKNVKPESFIKRIKYNKRVKELANNPLLLTLLCLAFEELENFPDNRFELYKEGLDALLKTWDAERGIYRDPVYEKLSVQRKKDLLSEIALPTLEQGEYHFTKRDAKHYIDNYIRKLQDANTAKEILPVDSEEVLKSIEAHHGLLVERAKDIYSFSHVTFHEYFTARKFVKWQESSEKALPSLVNHIFDEYKRWREVFLLVVEMLRNADRHRLLQLMKNKVNSLVADDEKLQELLICCHQKSLSIQVPYKAAAVRAFYLDRAIELHLAHIDIVVENSLSDDLNLDLILTRILTRFVSRTFNCTPYSADYLVFGLDLAIDPKQLGRDIKLAVERDSVLDRTVAFDDADDAGNLNHLNPTHVFESAFVLAHEPELKHLLLQLKEQFPNPDNERGNFDEWCKANGQAWLDELRGVMIKHRNIGQDWQFSTQQWEVLKQYYNANKLLVDCLNSDCYVSREVRQEIEDTLLLPIAEIEKREHRQ